MTTTNQPGTSVTPGVLSPGVSSPDQVSPKEVVARAKKFQTIVKRNWPILVAVIITGGVIGYFIDASSKKKTTYSARIVFNIGGGSGGGGGQMAELGALASAFGLGQSAPEASIFTGENFMLYSKSRPVLETTLMDTVMINDTARLLVNHYLEKSGIRDNEWEEDDTLRTFLFSGPKKREDFNQREIEVMSTIHARLGDELQIKQLERKATFMGLIAEMENVQLAKAFVEKHIVTIENDYKSKQTKKTREMLDLLAGRVNELGGKLAGTENKLAQYQNQNQQVVVAEGQLQENRLTRNTRFLTEQYYGAINSYENMKLSLIREQPLFTLIEPVILPLFRTVPPKIAMQAGLAIGLVLGIVIVFIRETLRNMGKPA